MGSTEHLHWRASYGEVASEVEEKRTLGFCEEDAVLW